jgi:hypothetical protein
MPEPELSLLFVRPLNQIGARYIFSGSVIPVTRHVLAVLENPFQITVPCGMTVFFGMTTTPSRMK